MNIDDFIKLGLKEKSLLLNDWLQRDAAAAKFASRSWCKSVRFEAAVSHYFLAQALKKVEGSLEADVEAYRCAILADGLNDKEEFFFDGKKLLLPKSFAEEFPATAEHASAYWRSSREHRKITPSFNLSPRGADLSSRVSAVDDGADVNYWPISFVQSATGNNGDSSAAARKAICSAVIRRYVAANAANIPRVQRNGKVVTLGSCFALNLGNALKSHGIDSSTLRIEEVINTTHANKLFLDQCLNGVEHQELEMVLEGRDLSEVGKLLREARLIVLTVGVAPVMEWVETGALCVTHKYLPLLQEKRIVQRFTTVEENRRNIVDIVDMLRNHNPDAQVCITLSPVPLGGVAEGGNAVERDVLSKSTLKVAIEEAHKENSFFYWPSFEVVKWVAPHVSSDLNYQAYGEDDMNSRHVSRWLVDVIVGEFIDTVFFDSGH